MNRTKFFGLVLLTVLIVSCKSESKQVITEALVKKHLFTLADDEMEGRKAGTEGIEKAAQYIESEFKRIGLENYPGLDAYRQNFQRKDLELFNVIGYLPGKSKKNELVVFSAHYDHLGVKKDGEGDLIFNGANDNASGTTAMLALAEYYVENDINERSILFIAFTAEELGIIGSNHFGKTIDPENIIAGINIEMIGKESSYGPKTAWLSGFDRSDLGSIVQKNVMGTGYSIHKDPYFPKFDLFFRSDNAALALLGVPAHTFSTSPPDDKDYHQVSDHAESLNIENIVETIKIIARGTTSFVDGTDTPTRVILSDEEKAAFEEKLKKYLKRSGL